MRQVLSKEYAEPTTGLTVQRLVLVGIVPLDKRRDRLRRWSSKTVKIIPVQQKNPVGPSLTRVLKVEDVKFIFFGIFQLVVGQNSSKLRPICKPAHDLKVAQSAKLSRILSRIQF